MLQKRKKESNIENVFNNYLLRNVQFVHNNKVLKSGKFLFFNVKEFYLNFILTNEKNEQRVWEVPYPFKIYYQPDCFVLDYKIDSFCNGIEDIILHANVLNVNKKNKFFNSFLYLSGG